jgi:hypothetical protein
MNICILSFNARDSGFLILSHRFIDLWFFEMWILAARISTVNLRRCKWIRTQGITLYSAKRWIKLNRFRALSLEKADYQVRFSRD